MRAPRNFFDVVFVGSEPAGLVAAALLSKRGCRVGLIPGAPEPTMPLLSPGGRSCAALAWVLGQLGLAQEMRNQLRRLDPALQVVLPSHRIDLSGPGAGTRGELAREFPGDVELVETWLGRVERDGERTDALFDPPPLLPTDSRRDVRQWRARVKAAELEGSLGDVGLAAALPEGHELRRVADGAVRFLAPLWPATRPGPGPLRLFRLLEGGVWVIGGGPAAFRQTLLDRLRAYGTTMLPHGEVVGIEPSWRGDAIVRTEKEPVACRAVVHAGDARDLPALLPEGGKRRRLQALVSEAREGARRRSLRVRARKEARPPGLGPLAAIDPGEGLPGLLRTTDRGDEVVFTLIYEEPSGGSAESMREQAMDLLRWVVPFVDEHVVDVQPLEGRGVPVYAASPDDGTGGLTMLPCRTPYKQIFLTGPQVLPGLGLEGELLAGIACAEQVARQVRLKDVLR